MIVFHDKRVMFFHIPKTGGSSITYILKNLMDGPNTTEKLDIRNGGWQGVLHIDGHQHGSYKDNIELCKKHKRYFKFAFVRNPWDLVLSWYLALYGRLDDKPINDLSSINPKGFRKFLFHYVNSYHPFVSPIKYFTKKKHEYKLYRVFCKLFKSRVLPIEAINKTQLSYISDYNGNIAVDYLGRFESLENDIKYIMKVLKVTEYDIPRLNVSNFWRINYQDFYDSEGRELISEVYRADIEAFGYEF